MYNELQITGVRKQQILHICTPLASVFPLLLILTLQVTIWTYILQEHLTTRQIPWKALACCTVINNRRKLSHKLRHTFLSLADLRRNCIWLLSLTLTL